MAQGASLPAAPPQTPGLPLSQTFYDFAGWNGIDTKPPRPGIDDDKCAWCDNLMPLGTHNIRAMPDQGPAGYTAPGGRTIIWYEFYGLASMIVNNGPHAIVFLDDGSAQDYKIFAPSAVTTLAPPGTFLPPAQTNPGVRQFGTDLLCISTEQSLNAYWVWDGATLFGAGSLGPEIDILDGGRDYTSLPTITPRGGSGTGAAFTSTIENGAVATVTATAAGSGYDISQDPQKILLTFSGGGGPTTAWGIAAVVNGAVVGIQIQNGGSGFTAIPGISITDSTGSGAQAIVTGLSAGTITAITMVDCGANYTAPVIHTVGGGGTGLIATGTLDNGVINSVSISDPGGPYLNAPQVFFLSVTGSGASGTAIINSSGNVIGVDFGHGIGAGFTGTGYNTVGSVLVGFSGGGVASATVRLMPFGVSGHAIESYQGRIWVTTTPVKVKTFGTAPGSATNFTPGDGGFVFPATESVLKYEWSNLRHSNGFLYLAGDSSVNAISGVTTSGAPATTTFSNQNIDPQIGSPWNPSVEVYSRAVIMANPFGIHAIYGGAVQKISTPLDGVFQTGQGNINPNLPPSAAIAEVFGVHVFMLLMPIIDPITGSPRNALLMWDGRRWWTASQNSQLAMVRTNEWGSTITAWGLDTARTHLFPMFQTATTTRQVTLRSKLHTRPGIQFEKKAMQLYAYWQANTNTTLNFTIDADNTTGAVVQGPYTQTAGLIGWGRSRVPDNMGVGIGFTMTSNSGDFQLMDVSILAQERRLVV
ncbi:MAG TPA: hypothetical protein VLL82_04250 [Mycobacterium sp.]|nr:hypothetical protein [Mycobacterium sp.]